MWTFNDIYLLAFIHKYTNNIERLFMIFTSVFTSVQLCVMKSDKKNTTLHNTKYISIFRMIKQTYVYVFVCYNFVIVQHLYIIHHYSYTLYYKSYTSTCINIFQSVNDCWLFCQVVVYKYKKYQNLNYNYNWLQIGYPFFHGQTWVNMSIWFGITI